MIKLLRTLKNSVKKVASVSNWRQVGEVLLPAIAYGDAAGLPVETKSAARIARDYGHIDQLIASNENPFYVGEFESGTWSDDTQLSMAVAMSLARTRGFDLQDMANAHVEAYHDTPQITKPNGQSVKRGWGGSTTASIERYMNGVSPLQAGEPDGKGNGVIMKMAPLAYWHIARGVSDDTAYRESDQLTVMTHANTTATVATRVHHDVLNYLATRDYYGEEFADVAYWSAVMHEDTLGDMSHDTSSSLAFLADVVHPMRREAILEHTDGKGFFVPQTLAMAYAAFMANEGDFTDSIYEAVNLGGDTDSTASIVAAMSLFTHRGIRSMPDDFEATQHYLMLRRTSREFARVAMRAS